MKLSSAPPILKHGGGGEGVEVIWTKSKRTATFFLETVPKESKCFYKSHLAAHEVKATTQCYSCGYMKKGDSIAEAIPEVPFCNGKKSSLILPVNQ